MEWLGQLVATIAKIAPAPLLAVGIATGIIVFASDHVAAMLGVDQFRNDYRGALGAAFILSWSYLLANAIWWGRGHMVSWWGSRRAESVRLKHLEELTPQEKGYLSAFIYENINTQNFPIDDGVIGGLLRKGIVYQSSSVIHVLQGVPYNLQPWARKRLAEQPELLEGALIPRIEKDAW